MKKMSAFYLLTRWCIFILFFKTHSKN